MATADAPGDVTLALRASLLYFVADPALVAPAQAVRYHPDGLLLLAGDRIAAAGDFAPLHRRYPRLAIDERYRGKLILPGFIDTHVHYPQAQMVAAFGESLLSWLDKYTYPTERQFADPAHCTHVARFFLDELLRHGTTSALVFCTVHPQSVDALFREALARNLRLIAGKVLMDRNAPADLCDTAAEGQAQSRDLIRRWHGRGRLLYAVTPRFAPTSSPAQLILAGQLLRECPGLYLHTHLAETRAERAWVHELFPGAAHYLDVYHGAGLVGERSVFAHGIHLEEDEFACLHAQGAALSFCPGSNLFLGSGLFRLRDALAPARPVRLGLGSDVGAGTSFNLLRTLAEAYQVVSLEQAGAPAPKRLSAFEGLYLATLGGARALYLDDRIGSLAPGHEADLVVLDWAATPLQRLRRQAALARRQPPQDQLAEALFALMMLGDERNVVATWVAGRPAWPPAGEAESP